LEKAKQEAEQANVAKSHFLAAASHDLRQPLQTLTLLQALLLRNVGGEKAPKLVARLGETLGAMSGMLNTLLDINQIEAGVVRAEPVSFPINDLLDRLRDEFTYHAQAQMLSLRVVPCSLHVYSDPRLLEQMIRNLLSNALKYTKRGRVLLGCRRRHGAVSIEIWDTGIGIPDGELQAIFEEYHQLDNAARERTRGLGLGLSIVKTLVQAHNGTVTAESAGEGRGATFRVRLPVARGSERRDGPSHRRAAIAGPHSPLDVSLEGLRVLLVDDDEQSREVTAAHLQDSRAVVLTASSAAEAMELLARHRVDVLLADIGMPDEDGYDLIRRVRSLAAPAAASIPAAALTAFARDEDRRQALQAGFQLHLPKPLDAGALVSAVATLGRMTIH
jgi:two-component system CheB/CheR fusion protein